LLGKDDGLLLDAGAAGEDYVDRLLEIEQPERQLEIARVEHLRPVAEAARIFVVPIEQEDAQIGTRLEDLLQDEGDAARLADAGRAEDGEMLAQHLVHVDAGVDRDVLLQVSDGDRLGAGHVVDEPQLRVGDERGGIADGRIVGDAALEEGLARLVVLDLAHHVEMSGGDEALLDGDRRGLERDLGHHADEQGVAALDAQELADGDAHVVGAFQARGRKPDARLRAPNGKHVSEQFAHCGRCVALILERVSVQCRPLRCRLKSREPVATADSSRRR
jgi:hypothetical protein